MMDCIVLLLSRRTRRWPLQRAACRSWPRRDQRKSGPRVNSVGMSGGSQHTAVNLPSDTVSRWCINMHLSVSRTLAHDARGRRAAAPIGSLWSLIGRETNTLLPPPELPARLTEQRLFALVPPPLATPSHFISRCARQRFHVSALNPCYHSRERSRDWIKIKNPAAPAARRLEDEDWNDRRGNTG
jgi:hypothetical protein